MSELLGWFNPTRWVALGVILLALGIGGYLYREHLIGLGYAKCQDEHKRAAGQAASKQGGQNTAATKEVIKTETVIEYRYRDKIKEVIRYEPSPGTVCPADADFLRLYNGTR